MTARRLGSEELAGTKHAVSVAGTQDPPVWESIRAIKRRIESSR
jgi:hypothetical protein